MNEKVMPLPIASGGVSEVSKNEASFGEFDPKRFIFVFMDLNNKCNLRCRMCHFSHDLKSVPSVTMSLKLFEKIAEQVFPKATQINLSCGAEPLIIPDFHDYLRIVKKYRVPVVGIVTNGTKLNEVIITAMFETGVTNIEISIDGATKKTYEKIRCGANFEKVTKNISLLQDMKKRAGRGIPRLHLNYTLMRSNLYEFPEFLRLSKRLNADSVRATHLIPFKSLNIINESLGLYREETNTVLNESRTLANELGLSVIMPPNFDLKKQESKELLFNKPNCRIPNFSMCIISDGRVIPCAWFPLKEWCAGNFQIQNFDEIWDGEIYKKLREQFKLSIYPDDCKNCPVWGDEILQNYSFVEKERKDVFNFSPDPV